jgi:hypothetical protein
VVAEYRDFYLHVGWPDERGRFPVQVIQSPCGETAQPVWQENSLRLPACRHVLDYLQELIAEPEEVELLGRSLHEFLFPPPIDEIFHRCREDRKNGLRVRLRIDPEELSLLPWEYCYDPRIRQYLALERQTPFVRYIAGGFAAPPALTMPQPVKLLVVLAGPSDQPELDMPREEAGIRQALRSVPVELSVLRHATIEKLHDALLEVEPHILHFSGHGVWSGGTGALALEKPGSGGTDPLTARQLRGLLNRMDITLAVLNACETARHSTRDALMGVAQALIREEIPAVIAMQFLVSETVALLFTRRLYDFLFTGDPLEKIVTETRVGIDINSEEDHISWGIPVLFLRARDGHLWRPETVRSGSGLEALITADLKSRPYAARAEPATTADILLNKVHRQWVVDVLARSIPNAERRLDFVFQQDCAGVRLVWTDLSTLFDETDNSLLLLGAPGSGKTLALCELARDLIQRAGAHPQAPLPVILRLAPWRAASQQDLRTWVESQVKSQYGLGQTHLEEIRPRGLILLLDGLDEVCSADRASCVKVINEYCAQEGWVNIVVTCRSGEYADLEEAGQGLTIPGRQVVSLAPLEADRIDKFLGQLDRAGVDVSHLHSLLENESTPLMTDVILQTYIGKPAHAVADVQVVDVWDNYVARKFEDEEARQAARGKAMSYPPAMTRKWLRWVALQLHTHTQDRHRYFVEELQPDWLPGGWRMLSNGVTFLVLLAAAYLLTRFTFQAGLPILYGEEGVHDYLADYLSISIPLGALWIVSISWVFARRSRSVAGPVIMGLLSGIAFGSMIWVPYREAPGLALAGGALTAVIGMGLVRIVIQILGFSDKDIVCIKRKRWDWTKAGRGLVIGVVFVLVISLVSDVARAMFYEGMGFGPALQRAFSFDTVVWWNWGLPGLLSMSLFLLLVFGLGWGGVVLREEVDLPNQGILDSGANGITVAGGGVLAGLIFSLAIGLPCYLGIGFKTSSGSCAYGDLSALWSGLGFGLGYGAILGLIFGLILGGLAWLRHHLLRLLLAMDRRQIPWRFERFLAYAAGIHLLRRVGGGFEFIDQELQAYFCANPRCD